jgi:c-di-GMP-binding flagellar brake protein YcgR
LDEPKETKPRYGIVNFERRKYPRFSVDLPIEYYPENVETRLSGRVVNASEGGLLIYLPERVEIGESLRIKLYFPSGQDLSLIEMLVQVVWIDIHLREEGEDYRSGVRFVDISAGDLVQLKHFLKGLSE